MTRPYESQTTRVISRCTSSVNVRVALWSSGWFRRENVNGISRSATPFIGFLSTCISNIPSSLSLCFYSGSPGVPGGVMPLHIVPVSGLCTFATVYSFRIREACVHRQHPAESISRYSCQTCFEPRANDGLFLLTDHDAIIGLAVPVHREPLDVIRPEVWR